MSRILVIGGYGGFGARLSRRLAAAGHEVLVGGRSDAKATEFAAGLAGATPVLIDRAGDVGSVLARLGPHLVIDAAGPFQASGYHVPKACIALGISYLDLADARDFVCGIGALDGMARTAGVAVVSGASSIPALSGAIARHLAGGLDLVSEVETALSASSRSTSGASVAAAILSNVGRPVKLWRGGRWQHRPGWHELRRERFAVAGARPLTRLAGLFDAPDHELLPEMLPGRPAATFRAGNELGFQMIGLWLASWPVRWGWLQSLRALGPWLQPLQRFTARMGSDRSAMQMRVKGWRDGRPVTRTWTVLAERGDGPEIPTLAAALLAEDILHGRIPAGARHAGSLLKLEQFEPLFEKLALSHRTSEHEQEEGPLYRRLMGPRFDALPPLVRAIHQVHGDAGAAGKGDVKRGRGWPARMLGSLMRFPPNGAYPLHVDFAERDGRECWTRHFGDYHFSSGLSAWKGLAAERFGPLRFGFDLPSDSEKLEMVLRRWSMFGIPLPLFLAPRITAREWQEEDRFRFNVAVAMPLIGPVIDYSGWLRPIGSAVGAETRRIVREPEAQPA